MQTEARIDRRHFIAGASAAIASMTIVGSAVLHTTEAWGLEVKNLKPETMRTLIKMARDIYPHDRIADQSYAVACKTYDEKSATDAKLKAICEGGVARIDAAAQKTHGRPYAAVGWESERVALLKKVSDGELFKKLRGDLVVSLYN